MGEKQVMRRADGGISLLLSIIVVFCILSVIVFSVARKLSTEMEASAIQNLSESLDLIESTIEAILNKDAEYQRRLQRWRSLRNIFKLIEIVRQW